MGEVGQPIRKKDAMALVTGKPVYMDDLAPKDLSLIHIFWKLFHNHMVQDYPWHRYLPAVQCSSGHLLHIPYLQLTFIQIRW